MRCDVPHDRYADPVSTDVIGLIVAPGKNVIVVQSHQAGGFPRREEPRPHAPTFDHQYCLTRGAPCGGPEASSNIIKTHFCPLATYAPFVRTGASVDRADSAASNSIASSTFRRLSGDIS